MKLKSIEEEKRDCLAAFEAAGTKPGDWVEYRYHDQPISILDEPFAERIRIIEKTKAHTELALRFRMFRPRLEKIPTELVKARMDRDRALAVWNKAWTVWNTAQEVWEKARDKHSRALRKEHNRLHPDSPWPESRSLF